MLNATGASEYVQGLSSSTSTLAEISLFTDIPTSVINKADHRDPYLQPLSLTNHSSHTSPLVTHSVRHLTSVLRPQDIQ